MKLIIASHNQDKVEEIKPFLNHLDMEICSLSHLGFDQEIIENGQSFVGNSLIKARTILSYYPEDMVLADDSGFCVKALNYAPGVFSHRFLGENTAYELKNQKIIDLIEGKDRSCYFTCAMTLLTKHCNFVVQKNCYGQVALVPKGKGGFGYDPIFIPDGYQESFAENPDVKREVSHRAMALKEMVAYVSYLKK